MKNFFTLIIILCYGILSMQAQDTLRSPDFADVGESFVMSIGSAFPGMNTASTGANFSWDFSLLGRTSQRIDTVFSPWETDSLLAFVYVNIPINSNRANQAMRGKNFALGIVGLNNVYDYFYKSTTDFSQPGFGAVVNGTPLPIPYSSRDFIYRFPLTYNSKDSSEFGYEVDLSSTLGLYYKVEKKRNNFVDGWGTLITPYGTFDALRIKSTIIEIDSVFIDTLGMGVKFPPVTTVEYKWLAHNSGLPLLQINTSGTGQVSQIVYQDSAHFTAVNEIPSAAQDVSLFPNPSYGQFFLKYLLNTNANVQMSMYSITGELVKTFADEMNFAGENIKMFDVSNEGLSEGNYILKIFTENSVTTKVLQIKK